MVFKSHEKSPIFPVGEMILTSLRLIIKKKTLRPIPMFVSQTTTFSVMENEF